MPSDFLANAKPVKPEDDFLSNAQPVAQTQGKMSAGQPDFIPDAAPQENPILQMRDNIDQQLAAPPVDSGWRGDIERGGQRAMQTFLSPVLHPEQTINGMADMATEPWKPVMGMAKGFNQDRRQGGMRMALDNMVGDVAGMALQGGVVNAVPEIAGDLGEFRNPTPTTMSAPELHARAITKAINPPVTDWNPYINTLSKHSGDILDFVKRSGTPIRTQLDFGNAAKGAGDEAYSLYRDKVLGPNAGYAVRIEAGKPPMTLGEIDSRIAEINHELRPSYQHGNMAETESSLAAKRALTAERDRLQGQLVASLAEKTGLSANDVSALRQRYGGLRDVSRETTEAVNRRESSQEPGRFTLPRNTGGLLMAPIDYLRGGKQAIADRALMRVLEKIPDEPTPLPEVNPPSAVQSAIRAPIWKDVPAGRPAVMDASPNPGDIAYQKMARAKNLQAHADKMAADRTAAEQAQALRRANSAKHPFWKNVP